MKIIYGFLKQSLSWKEDHQEKYIAGRHRSVYWETVTILQTNHTIKITGSEVDILRSGKKNGISLVLYHKIITYIKKHKPLVVWLISLAIGKVRIAVDLPLEKKVR